MKGSKKGKKSFADGLDASLHFTLHEDNAQDRPSMFAIDEETTEKFIEQLTQAEAADAPAPAVAVAPAPKAKEAKKQKSFADRLASFFDDSSAEEFSGNQLTAIKRSKTTAAATSTSRPLVGIDQLLNRTLIDDEEQNAHSRRITFTLPDDKLHALKELARTQGKPLSELVRQLIEWHLEGQPPLKNKKTKA